MVGLKLASSISTFHSRAGLLFFLPAIPKYIKKKRKVLMGSILESKFGVGDSLS
jgi:hypothetical protein